MHIPARTLLAVALAAADHGAVAAAEADANATPAASMAAAATNFLDALTPELRAKAMLPFADQGRMDWHNVPRERIGVAFKAMDLAQRTAARELVRSALSRDGANKVEEIMALESVLREI